MHILVTGATGFLGKHLCRALESTGHTLTKLNSQNCNLVHSGALDAFADECYDQIFHLAAWTQAGDFCLHHPGEQWIINQQINTHVLAWWQKRQPQARLICIGSSCAYDPEYPHCEENYLAGTPTPSLFTYGMTKRMLYIGLLALHQQFGLNYLCLVPSTLYGPGYHTDGRQMHFIFDLIRKILRGKRYGEPVILWGDGDQVRELIFVEDFVRLMIGMAADVENELVNIGAGHHYSIREFAQIICAQVGYDPDAIQYDTARYVGARSKYLVVDKLSRLRPDLSLTPLEAGLEKTIAWFQLVENQSLREGKQPDGA